MERKRVFEPGDMVASFTGQRGMVISEEAYLYVVAIKDKLIYNFLQFRLF